MSDVDQNDPEVRHPDDIGYDRVVPDSSDHHPLVEDDRPSPGVTAPDMEAAD